VSNKAINGAQTTRTDDGQEPQSTIADSPTRRYQGRLNLRGNGTFCVIGNVAGEAERCCHEVRFETLKCVKIRLQAGFGPAPRWGAYSAPPGPIAGFGGGEQGKGMERARDGKGTEGEGKERDRREGDGI